MAENLCQNKKTMENKNKSNDCHHWVDELSVLIVCLPVCAYFVIDPFYDNLGRFQTSRLFWKGPVMQSLISLSMSFGFTCQAMDIFPSMLHKAKKKIRQSEISSDFLTLFAASAVLLCILKNKKN